MKIKIVLTTLLLVIGVGGFFYMSNKKTDPIEVVELIQRNINAKGEITDYAGDINFRGFDSVGYEPIKDGVRVYFGDLQMDIKNEDLTDDFLAKLHNIGIDVEISEKTGDAIVTYMGKEVALFGKHD